MNAAKDSYKYQSYNYMNKLLSVIRYEGVLDSKKYKTYALVAMVIFISISFAYLLPHFAPGYFFSNPGGKGAWIFSSGTIFTSVATGLIAMLIGTTMSSDTISSEFESGTITRLFSMPVSRAGIYFGKLIEKYILSLLFSIIIVITSIVFSYYLYGNQFYLSWALFVIFTIPLVFMGFVSLSMMLGSIIRQPSLVFGIMIAIWIAMVFMATVIMFRVGFNYYINFIPITNNSVYISSLYPLITNPSGKIHLSYTVLNNVSKSYSLSLGLSASIEALIFIFSGYYVFTKARIR